MAHHVNTNTGEVSLCKAKKGGCPFGGESGTDNHYSTPEEARTGSEKLMEATYATINKSYRKKEAGIEIPEKMAQKVIRDAVAGKNKIHPSVAAKVFSTSNSERVRLVAAREVKSQKFLREMSNDESALVRVEVAKSSNNPAVLSALAKDNDPKVRKAALSNKKLPDRAKTAASNFIKSSVAARGANHFAGFESFEAAGGRPAWKKDDVTIYDNEDGTYTVQRNGSNMGSVEGKEKARRGADLLTEGAADVSTPKKFREAIDGDAGRTESLEAKLLRGNAAQGLNSTSPEYALAVSSGTHGTDLHGLSNNKDASIRAAVAKNPNTYPETLSRLSQDNDIDVLDAVANNENAHQLHRNIAGNNRNFLKALAKKKSKSESSGSTSDPAEYDYAAELQRSEMRGNE